MVVPFMLVLGLGLTSEAQAERPLVAVLDFSEVQSGLAPHEVELLGDVARGQALETLGTAYNIITRENLVDLLKAHGKTLEQCQGACETETGRLIGAEYVVSGRIVKAFGAYKVNLKMHRTAPPELVGAAMGSADAHEDLERIVREKTAAVLAALVTKGPGPEPAPAPAPAPTVTAPAAPSAAAEVLSALSSFGVTLQEEEDEKPPAFAMGLLADVGGFVFMGPNFTLEFGAKTRFTVGVRLVTLGLISNTWLLDPLNESYESAFGVGAGVRWYGRGRTGLDGLFYGLGAEYVTSSVSHNEYTQGTYDSTALVPNFIVGYRGGSHLFGAGLGINVELEKTTPDDDPDGPEEGWPMYPLLTYEIALF
jgi:hypothetical protein